MARQLAIEAGWKVVNTRWIDINRDMTTSAITDSHLVAKEFNTDTGNYMYGEHYSSTPPLEAQSGLVSLAATIDERGRQRVLMIADT